LATSRLDWEMARSPSASVIEGELRASLEARGYVGFHIPRYAFLLEVVDPYLAGPEPKVVLDVGLSVFTNILRKRYVHRVDTLDLIGADSPPRGFTPRASETERHYVFDLNELERGTTPAEIESYDVVFFCEVLEHLHISPRHVFPFLEKVLKPGGILVVQTPNAVTISNRVKLLAGRNPFGLIGEDPSNPSHFREYTLNELRSFGAEVGLRVSSATHHAYFDVRYRHGIPPNSLEALLWRVVHRLAPPSWRPGMTVVFERT
jgi:SAM-dependent methyltransferase